MAAIAALTATIPTAIHGLMTGFRAGIGIRGSRRWDSTMRAQRGHVGDAGDFGRAVAMLESGDDGQKH